VSRRNLSRRRSPVSDETRPRRDRAQDVPLPERVSSSERVAEEALEEVPVADRGRFSAGAFSTAVVVAMIAWPDLAAALTVVAPAQARLVGPYSRLLLRSLEAALARAAERLSDERCRGALAEFSDPAGRPLPTVLAGTGLTQAEYLLRLVFQDGDATQPCAGGAILAWTTPGDRSIRLCATRFAAVARRDPDFAAVILIHEEFHALGLSENPPSSAEISSRIGARCRR
jgi:hypothetical protein